jgi:ElaB/YqjD/DUF883 family membrane-anchored ribosome-binding protein
MMNASTDNSAWVRPDAPNSSATNRTAADLEREGEQIRADLDRTLDEIERKLSPGELLDRSVEFLRNNGSDFVREAGETVRNNPVPVLLTAAGLIWLTTSIASRNRRVRASSERRGNEFASYRGAAGYDEDSDEFDRSDDQGDGRIRDKVNETRSRVTDAAHRVSGKAHNVTDKVKGRLSSSMQAVQERAQGAGSNLMNLVREQPVALGALALAAGALIGAALPVTQYENRLVGPVRDRTMSRAKELGEKQYENLKQAVSSSLERPTSHQGSNQESNEQGSNEQSSNRSAAWQSDASRNVAASTGSDQPPERG